MATLSTLWPQSRMASGITIGTQSASGSRFVETLLTTTIETCRLQDRNVFDFVTQAVQASFERKKSPSLLPGA